MHLYYSNRHVIAALRQITEEDDIALDCPAIVGSWMLTGIHRTGDKGHASSVLKQITQDADAQAQALVLVPIAGAGLTQAQLEAWYSRHGFEFTPHGTMLRSPKSEPSTSL